MPFQRLLSPSISVGKRLRWWWLRIKDPPLLTILLLISCDLIQDNGPTPYQCTKIKLGNVGTSKLMREKEESQVAKYADQNTENKLLTFEFSALFFKSLG